MNYLRDFEISGEDGREISLMHSVCFSQTSVNNCKQLDDLISLAMNHTCPEEGKPVWICNWFTGKEQ